MKKKILVTTGTRAEYGFLRPLLKKIEKSDKLELILIVTGTHLSKLHGYTIKEIIKDGFKISQKIHMIPKTDDNYGMAIEIGKGIIKFSKCFKKFKPDINLILGDRDEIFASAIAAYHMNIMNAHIHGGDVSGGLDEYTRHAITKISNIHFAASKKSKKHIIQMGEQPKNVFFTGSPSIDEIKSNNITTKKELEKKYDIKLTGDEILLIYHSVTTESHLAKKQISNILNALIKTKKDIIAIYPNSDAGYKKIYKQLQLFSKKYPKLKVYSSFPRQDYLGLLKNTNFLIGNSSSGLIEASYFDTPVINIGNRQTNRERGLNVLDVNGDSINSIYKSIQKINSKKVKKYKNNIFGNGNASSKIIKILENVNIDKKLLQKHLTF